MTPDRVWALDSNFHATAITPQASGQIFDFDVGALGIYWLESGIADKAQRHFKAL